MIAITSLLVTIALSLLVTRVATMTLMLTGLSREAARFQSRSAFFGVGYTTSEAESIVNHPVRRQIVMGLMLVGNIGVATVVATMMVSFIDIRTNEGWLINLSLLGSGLLLLWLISKSRWVERKLNRHIAWAIKRFTRLDARDYVAVLNLQQGYAVTETVITPNDWLAGKSLLELRLPKEGVLVLGIQRTKPDCYIGAPTAKTVILAGDTLVLYGPIDRLEELDQRRAGHTGDEAHQEACTEHSEMLYEQEELIGHSESP